MDTVQETSDFVLCYTNPALAKIYNSSKCATVATTIVV